MQMLHKMRGGGGDSGGICDAGAIRLNRLGCGQKLQHVLRDSVCKLMQRQDLRAPEFLTILMSSNIGFKLSKGQWLGKGR